MGLGSWDLGLDDGVQEVVVLVVMHCEGCAEVVRRAVRKISGTKFLPLSQSCRSGLKEIMMCRCSSQDNDGSS